MHDVSRLLRIVVDKALKPLGVTWSQWWVLANLSRHDGSTMMQTGLATVLDMSKVALGGALDRLEENGLIGSTSDVSDGRFKEVKLIRTGTALLSAIQAEAKVPNQGILRGLLEQQILQSMDMYMNRNCDC